MTQPSQARPQRGGNECHHSLALLPCRGDAAKSHWFGYHRNWGTHKDAQVSFSWGYLGLTDNCTPSSWWVPYSSTKRTSWVSLALLVHDIQYTQSLKYRHSWRYRDRWVAGRALAGPRDVCDSVLQMLLEAGEVEAEDTACSECSFKICHFFGNLQYPSLFCTSSRAGHSASLAQRRVLGLKQKCKCSPGRWSHASWCAEPHPPRAH